MVTEYFLRHHRLAGVPKVCSDAGAIRMQKNRYYLGGYSLRRATTGSTREARWAGITQAAMATRTSVAAVAP